MSIARALLLLASGLLALPGLFVAVKGLAVIRRRSTVIQGKEVGGAAAVGAGIVLLAWGAGMLGFAALVLVAQARH